MKFFLGNTTEKRRLTILASFQKIGAEIKTPTKDELFVLGSPLGPKSQADVLEKKLMNWKKISDFAEKLDYHFGFIFSKIASVCQICCTSRDSEHVLIIQQSWKRKTYGTVFPKCVQWSSTTVRVLSWLYLLQWLVSVFHPYYY